jgi:hypothetical protein
VLQEVQMKLPLACSLFLLVFLVSCLSTNSQISATFRTDGTYWEQISDNDYEYKGEKRKLLGYYKFSEDLTVRYMLSIFEPQRVLEDMKKDEDVYRGKVARDNKGYFFYLSGEHSDILYRCNIEDGMLVVSFRSILDNREITRHFIFHED